MIVLEASALLELLLVTDEGRRVAERIRAPQETLHAPHLIDPEVAQVLRRYVLRRQLDEARASEALGTPLLTSGARLAELPKPRIRTELLS